MSSIPESCSRNSIGVLPPMSMSAASASTRNFGFAAEQGERNNWCKASTSVWSAIPIFLSPNSWMISDRSSPSPAPAVPPATLAINSSRNGRRSVPRNARVVSLAMPIRSAHSGADAPVLSLESDCMQELPGWRKWLSTAARHRAQRRREFMRRSPLFPAIPPRAPQIATQRRREIPMARRDRGGSRDRPRFRRRCRSSACRRQNPR